jgi:uncharacterized membrane protein
MALNTALAKPAHSTSTRFWEVDALRGMAVLAMIFFHFMWDIQFFELTHINVYSVPWQLFARYWRHIHVCDGRFADAGCIEIQR